MSAHASSSVAAPDDSTPCATGLSFGRTQFMLGVALGIGIILLVGAITIYDHQKSRPSIQPGQSARQQAEPKEVFYGPSEVTGGQWQIKPGHEKENFTLQPGQWAKLVADGVRPYKVVAPNREGYRVMKQNGSLLPEGDYLWDTVRNRIIHVQGMAPNQKFEFYYK